MAFNSEKCLKFTNIGDNPITIGIDASHVDWSAYEFSPDGVMWFQGSCEIQPGGYAYCYGRQCPTREMDSGNPFRMFGESFVEISGSITSLIDEGAGEYVEGLYSGGFHGLFKDCTQIKKVNNSLLSQPIHIMGLYEGLFEGCTNLEEIPRGFFPDLPSLDRDMLKNMFRGCSSLHKIYYPYTEWYNATSGWVAGVAEEGEFYAPEDLDTDWGEDYIPDFWDYIPYKDRFNPDKCLKITMTNTRDEVSIEPSQIDGSHYEFSKDGKVWVQDKIFLDYDESAYCRGTNYPGGSTFKVPEDSWAMLELSGNIMSLVDDGAGELTEITEQEAFANLFENCPVTKISADLLPATTLKEFCYQQLFYRTLLAELPENLLPAVNLPSSCYEEMFADSRITKVPKGILIEVESAEPFAYARMFYTSDELNEIYCDWGSWPPDENVTQMWVEGVAHEGVFHCPASLEEIFDENHIPEGWSVDKPDPFNPEKCLKFKALANNCTISLGASYLDSSRYQFSKDGVFWQNDSITLNNGEICYVKGTNYPTNNETNYRNFTISAAAEIVSGSIMSLVDNGAGDTDEITEAYGFHRLFRNCSNLKAIPSTLFSATILSEQCYRLMMEGCSGLTSLPSNLLPATEMAPVCYSFIFQYCTGLTTLPADLFPATQLAISCYCYAFRGCTNLTTLPAGLLPAETMENYCYYNMFVGCSKLACIPEGLLPATILAEGCYSNMFDSCSSLKEIHVPFDTWQTDLNQTKDWVKNVASTGDFYCPDGLPEEFGTSKIPTGWRVHKPKQPKQRFSMTFLNKVVVGGAK